MSSLPSDANDALSRVLIALMKGVTYRESDVSLWQSLLTLQARVRDYVAVLGLELMLDESEGHAYLRQRPSGDGVNDGVHGVPDAGLPRLVPRRQLAYPVSLLLALLRKKLAEFDAASGDSRLILSRDDLVDLVRLFLPDTANEARLLDRIDTHINKIVDLGFLRRLQGREEQFEVRRILKTFVDAQWLHSFEQRLGDYRTYIAAPSTDQDAKDEEIS